MMLRNPVELYQKLRDLWRTGEPVLRLEILSNFIVMVCTVLVIYAIIFNFIRAKRDDNVSREKRSIVETGTMTLFFLVYYACIRLQIGTVFITAAGVKTLLLATGDMLVIGGCIVNLLGRLSLGGNWGNQIRIYQDHTLVTSGVYRVVRHPLYASLIWMFLGGSLIYSNIPAFMLNVFIFIPFMAYRAKQEEEMLTEQFPDYHEYRNKVGMFFPKLWRG